MIRYISDKQATNESVICRAESATETATTEKSLYASMCTLTIEVYIILSVETVQDEVYMFMQRSLG